MPASAVNSEPAETPLGDPRNKERDMADDATLQHPGGSLTLQSAQATEGTNA